MKWWLTPSRPAALCFLLGLALISLLADWYSRPRVWRETGSLTWPRSEHCASLLKDGRVLVLGGSRWSAHDQHFVFEPNCEVFDPKTERWSAAGKLDGLGIGLRAVLPNGQVMVLVEIAHGYECELFDPKTNQWTVWADCPITKYEAMGVVPLHDGRLFFYGLEGGTASGYVFYDPSDNSWQTVSCPVSGARMESGVCLKSGSIYTLWNVNGVRDEDSAYLLDGKTGIAKDLNTTMQPGGLMILAGKLVLFSRIRPVNDPVKSLLASGTVLKSGRLLFSGGISRDRDHWVWTWPRTWNLIAWWNHIEVDDGLVGNCQVFDAVKGTWSSVAPLNTARFEHTTTVLQDGRVLVVGGNIGGVVGGFDGDEYRLQTPSCELGTPE